MADLLSLYKSSQETTELFPDDLFIPNSQSIVTLLSQIDPMDDIDKTLESLKSLIRMFSSKNQKCQIESSLLAIFDKYNVFKLVIEMAEPINPQLSLQSIKFIIHFTNANVDFADRFVENRLFYVLSNIFAQYLNELKPESDQNDYFEHFNEALQVIANLSKFNVNIFINRCSQILPHDLLKRFLATNNIVSLEKMAKIYFAFIKFSTTKSVLDISIQQICHLLSVTDHRVSKCALCGIEKYVIIENQDLIDLSHFQQSTNQSIFKFLESEHYDDQCCVIRIIHELIKRNCINPFHSEMLFPFVENSDKPELQNLAMSAIYESIRNDSICDKPALFDFLISLSTRDLFTTFSYSSSIQLAELFIGILYTMKNNQEELNLFILQPAILILFIRFFELVDIDKGPYIIKCLLKYLNRVSFTKEMAEFFAENDGIDKLEDLEQNFDEEYIKSLSHSLIQSLLPLLE